jgi:hypothetical protein
MRSECTFAMRMTNEPEDKKYMSPDESFDPQSIYRWIKKRDRKESGRHFGLG